MATLNGICMNELKFSEMKIIIYTPELNFKVGGIIVLHNLAKDLVDNGCNVMLYVVNGTKYENIFCNNFATIADVDDATIVVYPEIVEGNPLNAKNVVRWMLCDIGVHCSRDIYKTWGSNDLVFHFSTFNAKYDPHSIELLYTIWIDPAVKNKNMARSGSCYLFKKASAFHKNIRLIHPMDAVLIDNCSNEEIIEIFNNKEYFYCYDPYSFYTSIAVLCGCIPIVYPLEGVNKLDWLKTRAMFQIYLDKQDNVAGIAYGFDDVKYAHETLCNVEKEQMRIVKFGKRTVINFINRIKAYFHNNNKSYQFKTVANSTNLFGWHLSKEDVHIATLKQALGERNGRLQELNQGLSERDVQIVNFNQAVNEREDQIASLKQVVVERDVQIVNLNQAVNEREGQIASLKQVVVERDLQIVNLNQAMNERDQSVHTLTETVAQRDGVVAERDGQIDKLRWDVSERDAAVIERENVIRQILSSNSWRLSRPLRTLKTFFFTKNTGRNKY